MEVRFPDLDGDSRDHGLDALLLALHAQRTEVRVVASQQDAGRQERCQRGGRIIVRVETAHIERALIKLPQRGS
jgi:hypothetical protein